MSATDFGDYIDLLKTITKLTPNPNSINLDKVYFVFFEFVDRPKLFDNATELKEVYKLHNELCDQHLSRFSVNSNLADTSEYK